MTSFNARSALSAAAAVAAASFLVTAMAHVVVVPSPAPAHPSGFGVLQAEVHACMASSGRSHDECLDEIEGKALIQRAEWLAQIEERQGVQRRDVADEDEADASVPAPRSRAQ